MKLGFHGATTMTADLQTDVAASAHAGFQTLELWAAKVDRFLADHSLADLKAREAAIKVLSPYFAIE